jgi:hypothetical protein
MSDETTISTSAAEPPPDPEKGRDRLQNWLAAQTTNRGAIVMGFLTGLAVLVAAALLALVAGLLLHFFASPSSHVSGYVLIAVAVVCVLFSGLLTWSLARRYYATFIRLKEAGGYAAALERDQAQKELAELGPERDAVHRLGLYHSHLYNLVSSLIQGDISLADLTDDSAKIICTTAESLLKKGTRQQCWLSIWREPSPTEGRRQAIIDQLDRRLPVVSVKTFEILRAPHHTDEEIETFRKVNVSPSWLKWRQLNESDDPEGKSRIFRDDNLQDHRDPAPDIEAFRANGFRSIRAVSFCRGDERGYIAMLSKAAYAFSDVEGYYAVWLRHVIELDEAIRSGARQAVVRSSAQLDS